MHKNIVISMLLDELKIAIDEIDKMLDHTGGWCLDHSIDEQMCLIGVVSKNSFTEKAFAVIGLHLSDEPYAIYKKIDSNYCISIIHDINPEDCESKNTVSVFIEYNTDMYPIIGEMRDKMEMEIYNHVQLVPINFNTVVINGDIC